MVEYDKNLFERLLQQGHNPANYLIAEGLNNIAKALSKLADKQEDKEKDQK